MCSNIMFERQTCGKLLVGWNKFEKKKKKQKRNDLIINDEWVNRNSHYYVLFVILKKRRVHDLSIFFVGSLISL